MKMKCTKDIHTRLLGHEVFFMKTSLWQDYVE